MTFDKLSVISMLPLKHLSERDHGVAGSCLSQYLVAVRSVPLVAHMQKRGIKNQLVEDKTSDQLTLKEYYDPFTGEPANKNK